MQGEQAVHGPCRGQQVSGTPRAQSPPPALSQGFCSAPLPQHPPRSARKPRAPGCWARECRPWIQALRTVGAIQASRPGAPCSPKSRGSSSACGEAEGNHGVAGKGALGRLPGGPSPLCGVLGESSSTAPSGHTGDPHSPRALLWWAGQVEVETPPPPGPSRWRGQAWPLEREPPAQVSWYPRPGTRSHSREPSPGHGSHRLGRLLPGCCCPCQLARAYLQEMEAALLG